MLLCFCLTPGRLRHFHGKFNMPFLNKRWVISQLKHPTQRWIGFWWIINKDPFRASCVGVHRKGERMSSCRIYGKTIAMFFFRRAFVENFNFCQIFHFQTSLTRKPSENYPKFCSRKNIITAVRSFIVLLVFCHISLDNLMFREPSLPVSCPIHQHPIQSYCWCLIVNKIILLL